MQRNIDKLDEKVLKNSNLCKDDLQKVKDELSLRVEENEKALEEHRELNTQKHNETKCIAEQKIQNLKDQLVLTQKQEIEGLKSFVKEATETVNTNNDDIYIKYDEKLKKIKDVCAQYFSKYEKHLINHQTIVKDLERQQEQWVEMLIKP